MRFLKVLVVLIGATTMVSAQPHWAQTSLTGQVHALAAAGPRIFAGVRMGGVWGSSDGGARWDSLNSGLGAFADVITLLPKGSRLIAGTYGDGVFLSTNAGGSWSHADSGIAGDDRWVWGLGSSGSVVLAGTVGGQAGGGAILRSTDDGATWQYSGRRGDYVLSFTSIGQALFAGSTSGIYRSTDQGVTWQDAGEGYPNGGVALSAFGNGLFAGDRSVYRSLDSGAHWEWSSQGIIEADVSVAGFAVAGRQIFAGTWFGVYASNDSGSHWTRVSPDDLHVTSLVAASDVLFAGSTTGVWECPLPIDLTTGVVVRSDIPQSPRLAQNFPNPFNGSTVVVYEVSGFRDQGSGGGTVRLAVYDLLGKEVAVLVDERKAPGVYSARFDASGVSSGVYVYRLTVDGMAITRAMILLR